MEERLINYGMYDKLNIELHKQIEQNDIVNFIETYKQNKEKINYDYYFTYIIMFFVDRTLFTDFLISLVDDFFNQKLFTLDKSAKKYNIYDYLCFGSCSNIKALQYIIDKDKNDVFYKNYFYNYHSKINHAIYLRYAVCKVSKRECEICCCEKNDTFKHCLFCNSFICERCLVDWYKPKEPGNLLYYKNFCCFNCNKLQDNLWFQIVSTYSFANTHFFHYLDNIKINNPFVNDRAYYQSCRKCLKIEATAPIECNIETNLPIHTCYECLNKKEEVENEKFIKIEGGFVECKCGMVLDKDVGCNHIKCICGIHICFKCGYNSKLSRDIYNHMSKYHGGFFT